MTHPDAGRWVTASEAPCWWPTALGGAGVPDSRGRVPGEPTAPLQPETEARGEAGQCATPGRLLPARDMSRVGLWPAQPQHSRWSALH